MRGVLPKVCHNANALSVGPDTLVSFQGLDSNGDQQTLCAVSLNEQMLVALVKLLAERVNQLQAARSPIVKPGKVQQN